MLPASRATRGKEFQELSGLSTADEVLVLAGATAETSTVEGARLNLATKRWRGMRRAPLAWRSDYSAVWTGREVIVWGGVGVWTPLTPDGARYRPTANVWRSLRRAPIRARFGHSAVWTGKQMVIWGGRAAEESGQPPRGLRDGAAYDPRSTQWRRIARAPLSGASAQTAVWTGEEVIVLAGARAAAYDPDRNRWRRMAPAPLPAGSTQTAVWTRKEMVVWDGARGAAYAPAADRWRPIATAPLEAREGHTAVWTGRRMIVWGGVERRCGDCFLADGAAYDPARDAWTRLPQAPLRPRDRHVAVWTRGEMLVFGGCCSGDAYFDDAAVYRPARR